jgi:hypothetical protein
MQNTRTKVLRTLGVFAVLAALAATGVFSAFSSQTDNPGNVVTAGTVTLSDDDGGSALYSLTAAKPGDSATSCIEVTYGGTLDSTVKLYTPSSIGDLGPHVNLKIEPGSQASPSFPSCSGFTADAGGALYDGTLDGFAAAHSGYANGLADNPGTSATAWTTDDSVVYRVTATLAANTPDDAQGDSTGTHTLRWEARGQ